MQEETSFSPTPVPVAFLVCDKVIIEADSGKRTIVGVFDQVEISEFPAVCGPIWLYISVIDCEGDYSNLIEYVQVSTQKVLAQANGTTTSANRQVCVDLVLPWPQLPLPEAGEYEFRFWMNGKFISRTRVSVVSHAETEGNS